VTNSPVGARAGDFAIAIDAAISGGFTGAQVKVGCVDVVDVLDAGDRGVGVAPVPPASTAVAAITIVIRVSRISQDIGSMGRGRSPERGACASFPRTVTGDELLAEHVERFNAGVRTGDFEPMLELFADDASLEFRGVPVGPFRGRDAIAEAYRAQPPDDQVEVLDIEENDAEIRARYAWLRDEGRAAGDMFLTRDGDLITKLVVTFDS
jgi:steroid Delta-isomerase